ncbi:MAG: cation diffusion facilitator family transporter [Maribacter sp.]|jgi:cation diffusion facilitator family transporter
MRKQKNLKLPIIVLGIGVLLLILKFIAWWWTNSNAILTDALESIINIVAGIFALYSLSLAWKPKDEDHPYGHGKIEFLSAGFEGALILVAGLIILFKSYWDFFNPHEVSGLDLGLVITAFSGLVNYIMGHFLVKKSQEISSITLEASGKHLKSDAYSSIGLIIGLGIVMCSGIDKLDNVVAVLFGFIIIITGYGLLRKSIAGIMDKADEELIRSFVNEVDIHRSDDWVDMHNVRMIQYGSSLHLDCHLTLPWYYDTRQSHDSMKEFEDLVKNLSERPIELFVHVDPCEPLSCQICQKKDCAKRQNPQKERITWTFENTTANKKHNY